MSEPNGDLPTSQSTVPAEPSTAAEPAPLTVAPRVNPTSVYNPKDAVPPAPGAPAGFNEFVAWMQAFGGAQSAQSPTLPPPDSPTGRQVLAKEQKKFHRQGQEVARADRTGTAPEGHPAGASEGDNGNAGKTTTPPPPGTGPRTAPVIRKRRPQTLEKAPGPSLAFLIPWIMGAALLAACFLLGRVSAPRPTPMTASADELRTAADRGEVNVQTLGVIDQAMAAESKRDFDRASGLLEQARRELNHLPGLDYHLALVAFEKGDLSHAMVQLDRSIAEGEELAASYNLRGTLTNRLHGVNRGLPSLQTATQLDPFNARYYFFYGEALRRAGKPQAALDALQKAVDRLREPSLEGLYRLKMRLAKIELGQEKDFADELAAELERPSPPVDWLCTAAAVEIRAGRFENAAGYFDRALALPERQLVEVRLHDFFFFGYAHEKALARFYPEAGSPPSDHVSPSPGPTPAAQP